MADETTPPLALSLERLLAKARSEVIGKVVIGRAYGRFTERYTAEIRQLLGEGAENVSIKWARASDHDLDVVLEPMNDEGLAFLRSIEADRLRLN